MGLDNGIYITKAGNDEKIKLSERYSFWGDEIVWSWVVVMVTQPCVHQGQPPELSSPAHSNSPSSFLQGNPVHLQDAP